MIIGLVGALVVALIPLSIILAYAAGYDWKTLAILMGMVLMLCYAFDGYWMMLFLSNFVNGVLSFPWVGS